VVYCQSVHVVPSKCETEATNPRLRTDDRITRIIEKLISADAQLTSMRRTLSVSVVAAAATADAVTLSAQRCASVARGKVCLCLLLGNGHD